MYRFLTLFETRMKKLFYIKQSHTCILFFCTLRTCKKPILPIIFKYVFNQSSQSSSTTNQTNQTNGSKSPRHHIIVIRQGETIRLTCLMLNQKLDTQLLSVSGDCHNLAGALCITHPLNIFSFNFLTTILLSYPPLIIYNTYLIAVHSI